MIEQLITCFSYHDKTIRELASRAIMQVAHVEKGRDYIVTHNLIPHVVKLFEDPVIKIRSNAYTTLLRLGDFLYGIDAIIENDANVIQVLVDRLVLEQDETILILVLKLLKTLLEGGRAQSIILTTLAHSRLNDHMSSINPEIRELAALNLGSISFNERGKEVTIKAESIPILC